MLRVLLHGLAAALLVCAPAAAGDVRVAVAANFTEPAKEIARGFEVRTGHKAALSFGASGQFYAQIAHGAPYDVFLSADAERPERLEREGLGVAGSRFTYAVGRLALYSRTAGLANPGALAAGRFERLAIADPATAPYGQAAVETLRGLGLYDVLRPKLVQGASITQAYQFTGTGAAELGFVALSQVIDQPKSRYWLVPAARHTPIDQQAILLAAAADGAAARAFLAYLKSPAAQAVIRRHGYALR